jgi:hypothetical protein
VVRFQVHRRTTIFGGFAVLAGFIAVALPVDAQSVISAHSGVVHFFEGTVLLGDQPLRPNLGRYPTVREGAELRTADGRAEVLLTPGVFLRMNDHTAICMVASDLADTRVELLTGSIMVESGEPNPGTSVTLVYQGWGVHLLGQGTYRFDADPPRLWVRRGEVEVFAGGGGQPVTVEAGMSLPFTDVLVPDQSIGEPDDSLRDWTAGRSQSISADDAITAQIDEDPASLTAGVYDPVYFPVLGLPSPGLNSTDLYSSVALYQPGFSSIYLPGYTYRPLIFGLTGRGLQSYPPRINGLTRVPHGTGIIIALPRSPVLLTPVPHPAAVRAPMHIGGRR